ncbi:MULTISPECIES: hypothetical protein [unclassified Streptomyces]|uniref:hypothetical protein n=1 Tax=unclassified Streptomyces TaxID=2593676 RepID=UPI002E0E4C07|nr:hypothetical protein OG725_20435 [Streptomyces sp. NBC_01213]WSQ86700.1 hypothetical protein OG722_21115 [Streptomyces sp. NBC_01212]
MYDLIRRITACLQRLIIDPCTGRNRAGTAPANPVASPEPVRRQGSRPHLPAARSPYGLDHALNGGASALVRPYLLASDQEHAQRRRRLALVLAADFGLDLDLHVIGAQGVAA